MNSTASQHCDPGVAVGVAALLAIGLTACSSTATSAATPGQPGGRSPTTIDEVAAVTGQPMGLGNDAGTICYFSATADRSLVVYVQIYGDAHSMAAPKDLENGSQHLLGRVSRSGF